MVAIINFVFFILDALLSLMSIALIANAILSWLVAFDIVNLRNRFAYSVAHALDAVTRPVLAPFQRFIPTFGGIDVSPIVALLVIAGIRIYLLPAAQIALIGLVTPSL
jgi:YggT family protein